jgi:hypothetical protein
MRGVGSNLEGSTRCGGEGRGDVEGEWRLCLIRMKGRMVVLTELTQLLNEGVEVLITEAFEAYEVF